MVNPSGSNGYANGACPPDDELKAALMQYTRERLTLEQRILRLREQFGYSIRLSKLKRIQKRLNIPTVRKPPSREMATTLICEKIDEDEYGANGPSTIQTLLAMEDHLIPRSVVREVMADNAPEGAELRFPGGRRQKIVRHQLVAAGVFHEVSADGHQKLCSQALKMGPVGIEIYGMRDKWSGAVLHLVVVPNSRLATAIGHVYLDFVEKFGAIPIQVTVDHGSETGDMYAMQTSLRKNYTPHLDLQLYPAFVAITSTHNTIIESLWKWLRKTFGLNLLLTLQYGRVQGVFNPGNEVHINLFNWMWPMLVQGKLDQFTEYWNTHHVRTQENKLMPSGATPTDVYTRCEAYGGQRLSQPVPPEATSALRDQLDCSREEAFRWVDEEFAATAQQVYEEIGSPILSISTGWEVFARMSPLLVDRYN